MQATQFSPGMKPQTPGLGNPEIVGVRKHFNTRKIILFLLFPCYLHRRRRRKEKQSSSFCELGITFRKGVSKGRTSFLCSRFGPLAATCSLCPLLLPLASSALRV